MATYHAPVYFSREAFLHHREGENRAKETAAQLDRAVDELSRFAELDPTCVGRAKDTARLLSQFCSDMREVMDEIEYTFHQAASQIDQILEESAVEAHKNIQPLE